jgi:carbamoyl-phosphate synthase small subunit
MALAQGFDTYKLKYGHRGINHPVKDLSTNRVYITSQNHGYVVDEKTIDPAVAAASFISMNDGSIEGIRYKSGRCFSVQFHPEACGGPRDTAFLFDRFMKVLGGEKL